MRAVELRDRERLAAFLRRTPEANVYALADLDDELFAYTRWYALVDGAELAALALVFDRLTPPILYAVCSPGDPATRALLHQIRAKLPRHCFLHVGLGLETALGDGELRGLVVHQKMRLADAARAERVDLSGVVQLDAADLEELRAFYRNDAYTADEAADRFFEPYMLDTAPHFGIREEGRLVSAAGVHVLSDRQRVAALGNVATRPDRRGRGLARAASAAQCLALRGRVDHLGLNVEVANRAAIRCYESLGFEPVCRYLEGHFLPR